jgi:hypothetical protein
MAEPETDPATNPASDDARRRARSRRLLLLLLALVGLLALATVGYVVFYDRVLRDPDHPPEVLSGNPRVQTFEFVLVSVAVLVLGFGLFRLVKRRP